MREAFEDNIGIKYEGSDTKFEIIPSTFDFTNSPVIIHSKYKMSYDKKAASFPEIKNMIYQIIRAFKGQRGMIQTGSYENAKRIYDTAPFDIKPRLQLYNNSQEKSWMIEMHKATDDSVIIGPTLVEGVDLPGDLLRFIIIAKVPYPNLQDKLVKAKMNLFPQWYQSETANSIIQGIGRGNRFVEDWCVTYIIDGCFDNLYRQTRTQFPVELQKRIRAI
jgi:Rad3-related DNA helicase